jgi:peptide/nickel transport system permease protein
MTAGKRVWRRFLWSIVVVWATVSLTFLVNHALPSDPARMIAGQQAPPAAVARIRKDLGLDKPLYVQYGIFLNKVVHLDLGKSYQQRRPVTTILAERAPRTLLLAFGAALVQAIIGVTAGIVAAANKKRRIDQLTVAASLLGVSAPTFLIGLGLQWLLAVKLRIFPIDGYGETNGDHLACLVLPAVTLGVFGAAYYTRIVRDEMIGELSQDYIRTARAKGLSRHAVLLRHALRNALVPIITIFGLEAGTLVGGAIVTETVFRWPGIGSLSVDAMLDRDGPLIMGCVIITSSVVVLSTLLVDIAYSLLDPRLRASR